MFWDSTRARIIGEAENGAGAVKLARELQPDVVSWTC
jgi:YesN/AraC family two-component response regulator